MNIVLRITRHELDAWRESFLKGIFGNDLRIVTRDILYGDDPVASVKAFKECVETETDGNVVAVEAQAPIPILMKLVDRQQDLGVAFIRVAFRRGPDGRAIVVGKDDKGRDLLEFSHYEEIERIEFKTQRLMIRPRTAR